MEEDCGAVLRTEVRALAVYLRGVVHLPEGVEQLFVAYLRRIEGDLHDFSVAGFVGADVFVRRVYRVTAAVAYRSVDHPGDAAKLRFDPPKASCSECCGLGHGHLLLSGPFYPDLYTLFDAGVRCQIGRASCRERV